MHSTPSLAAGLLALSVALAASSALAGDDCSVPLERWQSRDAVLQHAARKGWNVERLKIDDGCYELRGKDAEGRSFKTKLDPRTLDVVKMKLRDADRDRPGDRTTNRHVPQGDSAAASRQPLFTPGTAPRGQVE